MTLKKNLTIHIFFINIINLLIVNKRIFLLIRLIYFIKIHEL